MREAQVNIAIRWFASYRLDEKLSDHRNTRDAGAVEKIPLFSQG
jgi:hypothetical protein